ncbi:methylenetetrahydrofolate--tRNA-(uracil(54)-C(5))-methyltransferase (FADH(2)-oxidizing) TrmFO [Ruminococcus albus]|uniref:Methylenetetrahydrofolate--tRNA-(uracil-5-)-methyltransferase TrmFO n=1 Tax=Ruminococcus albus 8 TaxID=246199 RepID=E9S872_RUMAL|nr:methylenetetrahydrofolate--tRNA-(uracil(54)-C(5))-methyltransferase (FADH(2)-oxidizing) TrmFO [Ruminococcus albus]EGC04602.1 tRNA:m(5)U-54 methyltransferase [Ruminococcus albus 8]MCC3351271.1 methylenetetrahydrofolate--tRNA-(uracil(54)-C(5))-methyltransferase (FADH(2)-oxidizing) TrmFO [Ruminococcus albus 8]
MEKAKVIGAGLAGCEAAVQLANAGIEVELYEMKPKKFTPAHKYKGFAELVCSNSLKADRIESAAGMLKEEMRRLGSVTMECAELARVSAGGALAVDREKFSDAVTERIRQNKLITVIEDEVTEVPDGYAVIATGPLTSDSLAESIGGICGEYLYFHDAAAPIVTFESLDMEKAFFASRYGRGDADYINCPMNKEEYEAFYNALVSAESAPLKEHDKEHFAKDGFKVYEGCMPVEVLAKRGEDTLRFGPLKPVGLTDPRTGKRPWAVVQLRAENTAGSMYNLVGFQTNLKFGEQKRVFSMIPGLENAEFMRYGVMHRNTFINSPKLLNEQFNMRQRPELYFAGQMTGVEGYIESAASGIFAGLSLARQMRGLAPVSLPATTMLGALSKYISSPDTENFQPMGCNMGILPEWDERVKDKKLKYKLLAERGLADLDKLIAEIEEV